MKWSHVAALGLSLSLLAAHVTSAQAPARKIKVLVYGGGVIHDFKGVHEAVMETLGTCPDLDLTSVTDTLAPAPAAQPGAPPPKPGIESAVDDMLAKLPQHDVLFFHHTGGKLTDAQEAALCGAIASGKGFVGIHSAADSFKSNPKYMDMIGGMFRTHPPYRDIAVKVLDPAHPIMKDIPAEFTVKDEQYILKYDPAKVHVLCDAPYEVMEYQEVVEQKDGKEVKKRVPTGKILESGQMPVVWTKPWDKGRVVYISLCHDAKAARQDVVKTIVLQSVLWAGTP